MFSIARTFDLLQNSYRCDRQIQSKWCDVFSRYRKFV